MRNPVLGGRKRGLIEDNSMCIGKIYLDDDIDAHVTSREVEFIT